MTSLGVWASFADARFSVSDSHPANGNGKRPWLSRLIGREAMSGSRVAKDEGDMWFLALCSNPSE